MQTVHTFRFVDALLPVFRQPKDSTHFCSFKNQWTDCCLNCAFHHSEDEARINVCLKIFTSHRNMETNGVSKTQQRIEEELSVHGLYKMGCKITGKILKNIELNQNWEMSKNLRWVCVSSSWDFCILHQNMQEKQFSTFKEICQTYFVSFNFTASHICNIYMKNQSKDSKDGPRR